jgi:hypothetical protein
LVVGGEKNAEPSVQRILIAAAIVIYGGIGLFGNRYVSMMGKEDDVWVSDRLTGAVSKCYKSPSPLPEKVTAANRQML